MITNNAFLVQSQGVELQLGSFHRDTTSVLEEFTDTD